MPWGTAYLSGHGRRRHLGGLEWTVTPDGAHWGAWRLEWYVSTNWILGPPNPYLESEADRWVPQRIWAQKLVWISLEDYVFECLTQVIRDNIDR